MCLNAKLNKKLILFVFLQKKKLNHDEQHENLSSRIYGRR